MTSTTPNNNAPATIKVSKSTAKKMSTTVQSKVVPKTKFPPSASDTSSTTTISTTTSKPKSKQAKAPTSATTTQAAPKSIITSKTSSTAPLQKPSTTNAKLSSSTPFDVKKVLAFIAEQPDLQNLRKASTSTTESTNSESSIMSKASTKSTASSFSTVSITRTETVKPKVKMVVKLKAAPIPTVTSETQEKVIVPAAKVATSVSCTVEKELQRPKIKAKKPVPKDIVKVSVKEIPSDKATEAAVESATKKVIKKAKKAEAVKGKEVTNGKAQAKALQTGHSATFKASSAYQPESVPCKQKAGLDSEVNEPARKKSIKSSECSTSTSAPKPNSNIARQTPSSQGDPTIATPALKKTKLKVKRKEATAKPVSEAKPAPPAAVRPPKTMTPAAPASTSTNRTTMISSATAVKPSMTPAKAAAQRAVRTQMSRRSADEQSVKNASPDLPLPQTTKSSKTKPVSATPLPRKTVRPQTELPSTRRKSVSFKNPLEAFQIIPARQACPTRSCSKRVSIAPVPAKSPVSVLSKKVEVRPSTPFAPAEMDKDADIVDHGKDHAKGETLVSGLSLPAKEFVHEGLAQKQPEQPIVILKAENDTSTSLQVASVSNTPTHITTPNKVESASSREPDPPSARDADVAALQIPDTEAQLTIAVFDPEIPASNDEGTGNHEGDESTVFYDVDESYVPHTVA